MKKNDRRQGRPDRFLGPLIKSAAADYAKAYMRDAENPPLRMPVELDEKCRGIIQAHQCSRTSRIRVALVAAVIAALLGMTSFAVYSEVRRELVMKRQEADEGCRITFDGTDEEITEYNIFGDISLGYIPDGFECEINSTERIRYKDEYGNSILFRKRRINANTLLLRDSENNKVISIRYNGYDGYKDVKYCSDGCVQIIYWWFDTDRQMVYDLITVGLSESEAEKILEGISCEYK